MVARVGNPGNARSVRHPERLNICTLNVRRRNSLSSINVDAIPLESNPRHAKNPCDRFRPRKCLRSPCLPIRMRGSAKCHHSSAIGRTRCHYARPGALACVAEYLTPLIEHERRALGAAMFVNRESGATPSFTGIAFVRKNAPSSTRPPYRGDETP